jgi:hypothetical protein
VGSGLIALGVAAAIPMGAYYAVFVNFEIPTLAVWLLCLTGFTSWRRTGRTRPLVLCLGAWLVGGLLDWPLYLGAPFLALLAWRSDRPGRRRVATALMTIPVLVVVGVSAWQAVQQGRWGRFPESHGLAAYLTEVSPLSRSVHLGDWFLFQVKTLWTLASIAFPCAAAGTFVAWYHRRPAAPLLGVLFSVGFLNVFLGAGRSNTHDYWSLYLLPWIALGCAEFTAWIARWRARRASWLATLLAGAIIATGGLDSLQVIRHRTGHRLAERGKALRSVLRSGEIGLTWPWNFQVPYYARHAVLAAPRPPRSLETLQGERHTLGLEGAAFVLFVLPGDDPTSIAGALAPFLSRVSPEWRDGVRAYHLPP